MTLVVHLGQIDNIKSVNATHHKVKIHYHNYEKLDLNAIKNLPGISGVFINDKAIDLIVGNQAALVATALQDLIN